MLQKVYRIALNINDVVSYIIVYCSIIKLINMNALKYACDFHRLLNFEERDTKYRKFRVLDRKSLSSEELRKKN